MSVISFGEVNKSLLFILFMSISMVFNQFLYGFTYIECFYDMNIYRSLYQAIVGSNKEDFPHHRIFDPLFSYLGVIALSLFIPKEKVKKREKNEEIKEEESSETSSKGIDSNNHLPKLIHNELKNYLNNRGGIIIFILILILWIIEENLVLIYVDIFQDLDFWFFELIFISIIFSNHFIFKIYSHQKLSMALSIGVGSILKIYNISISLISEDEKIYKKYPLVFFFVILYFLIILARSYVNTQIKVFMDLKFITHRTLLMSYGLTGASLCFIAGIIMSFVPCSDNKAIEAFVCKVKYNDNLYYDEIHSYIESSKNMSARLIIIVLGIISFFCNKFFYTLIIKNYTPIHVIFSFPMQFFIEKTFLLIFTAIFFRSHLFSEENQLEKFLLDISGDIASIIGFLIYLEIIELNFCKLNYNSADFSEESDAE